MIYNCRLLLLDTCIIGIAIVAVAIVAVTAILTVLAVVAIVTILAVFAILAHTIIEAVLLLGEIHAIQYQAHVRQLLLGIQSVDHAEACLWSIVCTTNVDTEVCQSAELKAIVNQPVLYQARCSRNGSSVP